MRTSDADILFIPGLGGSGQGHWQRRWADKLSTARLLELPDAERPSRDATTHAISHAVSACDNPVVLVAHSLGVIATIHAIQSMAQEDIGTIRGALLVAPPGAGSIAGLEVVDPQFLPIPATPLPFPSIVVGSQNDVYATVRETEDMAMDWGAQFTDAGEAGHINIESGHGPWPEGLMRFAAFMRNL